MKVIVLVLMGYQMFSSEPFSGQVYYLPHGTMKSCHETAAKALKHLEHQYPNESFSYICKDVFFEAPGEKI